MEYQNLVIDFAKRTRHNLRLIKELKQNQTEVYEVTQLINSMLGLLVFPKESFYNSIPEKPINELGKMQKNQNTKTPKPKLP